MSCHCMRLYNSICSRHVIRSFLRQSSLFNLPRCIPSTIIGKFFVGSFSTNARRNHYTVFPIMMEHRAKRNNILVNNPQSISDFQITESNNFCTRKRVVKRNYSNNTNDTPPNKGVVKSLYEEEKLEIKIINEKIDIGRSAYPFVYKYSTKGFNIGGNRVYGSVALLHKCILSWKVLSHHQITPESLTLFAIAEPKIEILVLGLGDKVERLKPEVYEFCSKLNISLEILDTPNACATYNFLTEEGRITAAALIPPQTIKN